MRKTGLIAGIFLTLFLVVVYITKDSAAPGLQVEILEDTNQETLAPIPPDKTFIQTATVFFRDLRVETVDVFFIKYGPKMKGLGTTIVASADRYTLPYGILPAIGACEGGLGNAIPANSFNTWGWGVYGGKAKKFPDWETAIAEVSFGLASQYFAKGLDTPEKIMSKYAPQSSGGWAQCVNKYLADFPDFIDKPITN